MGWKFTLSFFAVCTLFSWQLNGQTDCGTSFFDLGGANGNYSNTELAEWTFCPDEAGDFVTLSFLSVEVESCCDVLSIYNGTGTGSPIQLDLENPDVFTSTADDGCLTVTWSSDTSVTFAGWEANISCAPPPPCPNPTMLSLVNATSSGAVIQWDQAGDITLWDIEVVPAGTPPTGTPTVTDINTSPYTWDDGESGISYDLYIRAQCEEEGEFSFWVGPLQFVTIPACGDSFYDSGGPDGNYQDNELETWVFCPDTPGDLVTLDFLAVAVETCCDVLSVYNGSGTNTPFDADLEAPATFISSADDGCLTVTWDSDGSVDFAGWEATINCAPPLPCPEPTMLSFVNATSSGAIVQWDQVGNVTLWDIEVVPVGTPPTGVPTVTDINASPYTWDAGESGTTYDFYLRGQCENEGEFTDWVGPITFITNPACGDSFYDSGGPNGNYQDNELQTWVFCPDNPGDEVTLDFLAVAVESCCDVLSIYNGSGTDTPIEIDLEDPALFTSSSSDGCLTVTWDSDGSVDFAGWEATISCAPAPPCPNPTMLSLMSSTSTGAIIEWEQEGDVTVWDMEIIPAGTPPTGVPNTTNITASPYTWDQGVSGTQYDVYLRGRCNEEELFSYWVGPITFTVAPGCGDLFYDTGGPESPYQVNEELEWVFCPDNPGDQVTLAFLFVEIDQTGDNLSVHNGTGSGTVWEADLESPDIFTSNAEDGCLTVIWNSDGFNPLAGWIAAIGCNPAPPCPNPIQLEATNVTSSGATLNWTEFGDAESWNIEIVPVGTMATGTPTFPDITTNPFVWDGGESGIEYEFYVQANCPGGTETSYWTGPESFTTIPACGDFFYDPEGPDGQYASNTSVSYTFCPDDAGDVVVIDFSLVDVQSCCDDLSVYNGNNTDNPLEIDLEAPATFTSTADNGCLTVTFDSNGGTIVGDGWEAFVVCTPCPPPIFPQDVSTVNIAATQTDVLISTNVMGNNFIVEVDTAGFTPGTGMVFNSTDTLITMSGLTENTDYEYYLTYVCPDGQDGSVLGPFPFTTIFSNDLGITGLLSPDDNCGLTSSESISIAITNFGANPQTLFPINFAVNGVLGGVSQPQDGFYTGIVSRDSTEIFEFDLQHDFSEPGEYTIEIWTEMMEDTNFSNDTFTIVVYNLVPPLYEDFETGILPDYFEASSNSFIAPMGDHSAPSSVLSASFDFSDTDPMWLDFPSLSSIAIDDVLYFDYRYVDLSAPNNGAFPSPTDSLKVMISIDCGETYEVISAVTGLTHSVTSDMTTVTVPLENYEGLNVKLRIEGSYGIGFGQYFLDIDNINVYRCTSVDLEADITGAMPGMDDGQVVLTPNSGVGPYEYLWEDGSTAAIRNDLALGNYTVSVTDNFGCTGEITLTVDVFVSNEELPEVVSSIKLAPNPTSDLSILRANFNTTIDARVEIVNMLGQTVWRGPILQNVDQLEQTVDLSNQANGIYLVRIHTEDQVVSRKLVKAN